MGIFGKALNLVDAGANNTDQLGRLLDGGRELVRGVANLTHWAATGQTVRGEKITGSEAVIGVCDPLIGTMDAAGQTAGGAFSDVLPVVGWATGNQWSRTIVYEYPRYGFAWLANQIPIGSEVPLPEVHKFDKAMLSDAVDNGFFQQGIRMITGLQPTDLMPEALVEKTVGFGAFSKRFEGRVKMYGRAVTPAEYNAALTQTLESFKKEKKQETLALLVPEQVVGGFTAYKLTTDDRKDALNMLLGNDLIGRLGIQKTVTENEALAWARANAPTYAANEQMAVLRYAAAHPGVGVVDEQGYLKAAPSLPAQLQTLLAETYVQHIKQKPASRVSASPSDTAPAVNQSAGATADEPREGMGTAIWNALGSAGRAIQGFIGSVVKTVAGFFSGTQEPAANANVSVAAGGGVSSDLPIGFDNGLPAAARQPITAHAR